MPWGISWSIVFLCCDQWIGECKNHFSSLLVQYRTMLFHIYFIHRLTEYVMLVYSVYTREYEFIIVPCLFPLSSYTHCHAKCFYRLRWQLKLHPIHSLFNRETFLWKLYKANTVFCRACITWYNTRVMYYYIVHHICQLTLMTSVQHIHIISLYLQF